MPEYQRLSGNIAALVRDAAIQNSIDVLSNKGDDQARTITADWIMTIAQRTGAAAVIRRHEQVKLKCEKRGKHWRIVSVEPVSFFDAPRF
jgi:hypothetical protein